MRIVINMQKNNVKQQRVRLITIAIVLSIVLYVLGVVSGLFANNLLKKETQQEYESLREYVRLMDSNLQSWQMEQQFLNTLSEKERCNFSRIAMGKLTDLLSDYWATLPFRLEEFEKNNVLSPEYLALKKQYTQHSIRTWIVAKDLYEQCGHESIVGLYFYTPTCNTCTRQGEELDELRKKVRTGGKELMLFVVDSSTEELIVQDLKEYYNITMTPALIFSEEVYQGQVFTAEELMKNLSDIKSDIK